MSKNKSSKLTLREEESRHPVGSGLTMSDPVIDEGTAVDQVIDPAPQGLEGGVCSIGPQAGYLTVEEGCVDQLQLLTHHNKALNGLL